MPDGGHHRSLFVALAAVHDPRDPRGRRYSLVATLAAAVCVVIARACTFAGARLQDRAAWARLGFSGRVPAATTAWRLLINGATSIAEATREASRRPHDLITAATTGKPTVNRTNRTRQ